MTIPEGVNSSLISLNLNRNSIGFTEIARGIEPHSVAEKLLFRIYSNYPHLDRSHFEISGNFISEGRELLCVYFPLAKFARPIGAQKIQILLNLIRDLVDGGVDRELLDLGRSSI